MANATAAAAAAQKAKKTALAKQLRQLNNVKSAEYFTAGVVAMMTIYIISHWTRVLFKRYHANCNGERSPSMKGVVSVTRSVSSLAPSFKHLHS